MVIINTLNKNSSPQHNFIIPSILKNNCSYEKMTMTKNNDMKRAIVDFGISVLNGSIYIFGGWNFSDGYNHAFKYENNIWSEINSTPSTCSITTGSATFNNKIHIFGGDNYKQHDIFDGTSYTKAVDLPYAYRSSACCSSHKGIFICGGVDVSTDTISDNSYALYKFVDGTYTVLQRMPFATHHHALFYHDNKIFIMSATDLSIYTFDGTTYTKIYTPTTGNKNIQGYFIKYNNELYLFRNSEGVYKYINNTFYKLCDFNVNLSGGLVSLNDKIHMVCGYNSQKQPSADHYVIDVDSTDGTMYLVKNGDYSIYCDEKYDNNEYVLIFCKNTTKPIFFIYDKLNTNLIYTNQIITYNSDSGKYEIYGYFPTTLKNTIVPITQDGWQTLELDEPRLFK